MAFPQVVAVASGSAAERSGLLVGDEIRSMNGSVPKDVIEFHLIADEAEVAFELSRGGLEVEIVVEKSSGEPLGVEVSSALFDRVRTCDNHCEFCFIYQLPKGMRKSLYVKDDDYRLSFLYGNFTTLTRFTELDLERVVTEALSPLYVSIHATDPAIRAAILHNRRGATSLRFLGELLAHKIVVHGQIVVCPGVNDGAVLEDTLCGILERFSDLASVAAVPLGVSKFSKSAAMRAHTQKEARAVLETIGAWQEIFQRVLGKPMIYAADEYYLLAGVPFPPPDLYGDFAQHENGIGMATLFAESFNGKARASDGRRGGFFQSVDGAPAEGYRAPHLLGTTELSPPASEEPGRGETYILTGPYGARVIAPLLKALGRSDVQIVPIDNAFFGGNIAVAGLLTGADIKAALEDLPIDGRYLLPDVCLSEGRFLDAMTIDELPRRVEVIETTGAALRRALLKRRTRLLAVTS